MMPTHKTKVSLLSLPSEVLIQIFSYLSGIDLTQVSETCPLFKKLTMSTPLWKRVVIDTKGFEQDYRRDKALKDFYINTLYQNCIISNSDEEKCSIALRSNPLTVRDVVESVVEDKDVWPEVSVTGGMVYPNLRQLKLTCYSPLEPSFLLKYGSLHQLELLISTRPGHNLSTGRDVNTLKHLFKVLGTVLTTLETLRLQLPQHCKPKAADVQNYFRCGPKLRRVALCFEVNDDIVEDIVLHCSELEELELTSEISAHAFRAISERPNLSVTSIKLDQCNSADNKLFIFASLGFPNLKSLTLNRVPNKVKKINAGMRCLLESCRYLTSLDLHIESTGAEDDDDDDMEPETELSGNHYLFSLACDKTQGNLQTLALSHFNNRPLPFISKLFQNQRSLRKVMLFDCILCDEDILALANNCSWLQTIWIYDCKEIHVSDRTISALWKLPHLQELNVDCFVENLGIREGPPRKKRKFISDEKPQENEISRLQRLSLPASSLVFIPSRLELFERTCRGLQTLSIYENQVNILDDDDLKVILRCCAHLQELRLTRALPCPRLRSCSWATPQGKLTDASLRNITVYGQNLKSLRLSHSPDITLLSLANLVAQSPALTECSYAMFPERMNRRTREMEAETLNEMSTTLENLITTKLAKRYGDGKRQVETRFPFELALFSGTWVKFTVLRTRD